MGSDNVTSGDNQQETARPRLELDPQWVVGFVDGEGCFSVSIHRNPQLARLAYGMNAHGKQRSRSLDQVLAGSSETARQAHQQLVVVDAKIQSDLHGDMQS